MGLARVRDDAAVPGSARKAPRTQTGAAVTNGPDRSVGPDVQ